MENTIAAIATATGNGGIGIIRISGPETFNIINKIFIPKNKNNEIKGYSIKYGNIVDPKNNEIVDEVLVSYFVHPRSYTTEDICEINTHGGIIVERKILNICIENGARLAEPGEFTKRAFLNGRIDLSQAEAIIDLINAKSDMEAKESINQLKGNLSSNIEKIENKIMDIMVNIEVIIDYPEYDVEEITKEKAIEGLNDVKNDLKKLEQSFERGKILRDGVRTVILGKPNAGKSSLLNAILNENRAIVSNIEGTTRDTIEEFINVDGISLKLIDTAGIREAKDEIEKQGIEKSLNLANNADLIIAIFDITKPLDGKDEEIIKLIKEREAIIALNKIDCKPNKEVEERLKKLRKLLNLNQAEFAEKLNLSRGQIACYETGRRSVSSRTINDICREFNVNKYWLLNGEGEIFLPQNDNDVAEYIKSLNMSDFEMELLEKFLQFDSQTRINILEFATKTFNIPPQAKETQSIKTEVELAEEAYIKSVSKLAPNTDYSVTNTTSDKNKEKLKVVK